MNKTESVIAESGSVSIRPVPYPFRSMLAISSDLDSTRDRHVYLETMRFLNTNSQTKMGEGVGMEFANSIYFDTAPTTFSYWNTDDKGREMVRDLIYSGHIDTLHSYGERANVRSQAERNIEELAKHNCRLKVWVDHGSALSNFGADIMNGFGDVVESPVYHADITTDYGIKYVSRGRVTSLIGQNVVRSYKGIWNPSYPFQSSKTLSKEFVKGLLARIGKGKYEMNRDNRILRDIQLRSGQKVYEFLRSNPHWGGPGYGATAAGIADVLTEPVLGCLADKEGFCIIYTHLGKIKNPDGIFPESTVKAFRLLSKYYCNNDILVAGTERLLDYCRMLDAIRYSYSVDGNLIKIDIERGNDQYDIEGLSLYVPDDMKVILSINGKVETRQIRIEKDWKSRSVAFIPWKRKSFPDDYAGN